VSSVLVSVLASAVWDRTVMTRLMPFLVIGLIALIRRITAGTDRRRGARH